MNATSSTSSRLAQSASALGAAILGFGIGAKWGSYISSPIAIATIIAGGIIHVLGMYLTQMKGTAEQTAYAKALWISAWICLASLLGLVVYLLIQNR
jgi:hypothetical protein